MIRLRSFLSVSSAWVRRSRGSIKDINREKKKNKKTGLLKLFGDEGGRDAAIYDRGVGCAFG